MNSQKLILIAVGDLFIGNTFEDSLSSYLHRGLLPDSFKIFNSGDIVFGNLECTLPGNGHPIFKVAPKLSTTFDALSTLKELGFNILNLANNHIKDYNYSGVTATMQALESLNIGYVGAGYDFEEAIAPKVVVVRETRIGFLGFCDREESIAKKRAAGAAEIRIKIINQQIDRLKNSVDYIVLSLHMGIEFVDFPSPYNIEMCRQFIDRGVTVVLGHHPHVPQGYEFYNGGLIIYSLGNFIFDMGKSTPEKAKIGYIYQLVLINGNVEKVTVIPYKMDENYIPHLVKNEIERSALLLYLKELSTPLKDPYKMEQIWYSTSRFFSRQLIKALLYRTFSQGKWWFPIWWLKKAFQPQVRKTWACYIRFLINGAHRKKSKYSAFAEFSLGNEHNENKH